MNKDIFKLTPGVYMPKQIKNGSEVGTLNLMIESQVSFRCIPFA